MKVTSAFPRPQSRGGGRSSRTASSRVSRPLRSTTGGSGLGEEEETEEAEDTNEFPENILEETTPVPEPPSVADAIVSDDSDKPPEKKISLSIEKLRKMVDEQDK